MVLDMIGSARLPPFESMSPQAARALFVALATQRPPGPSGGRDRRRHAARRRPATLELPAVPAGHRRARTRWSSTSTAAAGCSAATTPTTRSAATCACGRTRSSSRSTTGTRPRPASPPRWTTRSPRCTGSSANAEALGGSAGRWRWPAGAPAATSPRSSASSRATPAARRSPASCCSRRSPTAT